MSDELPPDERRVKLIGKPPVSDLSSEQVAKLQRVVTAALQTRAFSFGEETYYLRLSDGDAGEVALVVLAALGFKRARRKWHGSERGIWIPEPKETA